MNNTFLISYVKEINSNVTNWHDNNYDYFRFGLREKTESNSITLKMILKKHLRSRGYVSDQTWKRSLNKSIEYIEPHINQFDWLYNNLADEESKNILLKVLAFRVLGYRNVKLPLNTPKYWKHKEELRSISDTTDNIKIKFNDWKLSLTDMQSLGIPIKLYCRGVYNQFILEQYRCKGDGINIGAELGDYVIDAGACFGDTALYFSNCVGPEGKIFSYEFDAENLGVFMTNLNLNPILKTRIEIIQNAVWDISNQSLSALSNGPASKIAVSDENKNQKNVITLSIDDLVQQKQISKINLIKMDIEGAELKALKGAINTIKSFRPKLAISVYHKLSDFYEIPQFIESLNLGYKLYLIHYTIHQEETVLFAEAR